MIAAGDAVDRAASALLVGTKHVVQPGEGALLTAMLTRRRPNFTADAYRRRGLGEHAPFGLRIGAAGYRQLHADADALPRLPPTDRFDGAGMVFFRDLDHARTVRATPEVARDATRDQLRMFPKVLKSDCATNSPQPDNGGNRLGGLLRTARARNISYSGRYRACLFLPPMEYGRGGDHSKKSGWPCWNKKRFEGAVEVPCRRLGSSFCSRRSAKVG